MKEDLLEKIKVPESVNVEVKMKTVKMKSDKGELERTFEGRISIKQEGDEITLESKQARKQEKRMLMTIKAHLKNMIKGLTDGFIYKMKVAHVHFPMSVAVEGSDLIIKNFLGETKPRKAKIREGVKVNVKKDEITIESINIEYAGQTAGNFEKATKVKGRDTRIFQDGGHPIKGK